MGNLSARPSSDETLTEIVNKRKYLIDVKRTRVSEEGRRLAGLLGIPPESVVYNDDGLGKQSTQFSAYIGGVKHFLKGRTCWKHEDLQDVGSLIQGGDGYIPARLDSQVLLKRERELLRCWNSALDSGSLVLPDDSLLVLPRLVEGLVQDVQTFEEEECSPSFLVMEDLTSSGFTPCKQEDPLTPDDGRAVSIALADLHCALWKIRDKLKQDSEDLMGAIRDTDEKLVEAKKLEFRQCFEDMMCDGVVRIMMEYMISRIDYLLDAMSEKYHHPTIKLFCHCDPWVENIMLRRDETGKVNGVAFVDFASVSPQNPLLDLYGFLSTSVSGMCKTQEMRDIELAYAARVSSGLQDITGFPPIDDGESLEDKIHARSAILHYFTYGILWNSKELASRRFRAVARLCALLQQVDKKTTSNKATS